MVSVSASINEVIDTGPASGVARIWCEEEHETKRKEFKGDTQKYYEIHTINSDKAIGQYFSA